MSEKEDELHWADEKEVVSSSKPLKFLLLLFKVFPRFLIHIFAFPVGFFYFLFSSRARKECIRYQKQMREYTEGLRSEETSADEEKMSPERKTASSRKTSPVSKTSFSRKTVSSRKNPPRIRASVQIISFSLCVLEKMEGWLGKIRYENLISEGEDLRGLIERLERGEGAVLIGSHLGNIELLRSLSSFNRTGVKRNVPVTTIMEMKATEQFNKTLEEINPGSTFNVIDPENITPDTMIFLQEQLEKGGLVVFTADRTSARSRTRVIRKPFLGKEADFPYGVFLLAQLLKAPVYYVFGLRTRTLTAFPRNYMFIEKSAVSLDVPRSKREEAIASLADEYVKTLEKYTLRFPYQWYNFYNFWLLNEEIEGEK